MYWTAVIINNILSGNNTAWLSTYNSTYASNVNTDSWVGNASSYYPLRYVYNKTEVDNNFSKYMSIVSWNTNLTSINNNINLNNTNAKLYANTIVQGNLTGSFNTTYNNYVVANISNLTYNWRTNNGTMKNINTTWLDNTLGFLSFKLSKLESWFTGKLTDINNNINLNSTADRIYTNTNIAGNLSLTLLVNGSRAMTGDLNMNGNNITNVKNISFGGSNNIYGNTTCIKIKGATSLLEIC